MGVHNRITEERFKQIKKLTAEPKDDGLVADKLGVSPATVKNIRLSKDYQEYCERVFRFHGHPKSQQLYRMPKAEFDDIDFERGENPLMSMRILVIVLIPAMLILAAGLVALVLLAARGFGWVN